jgi:hypothetical protein
MSGALERLPDGEALLLRWPPCNGGFTLGFNPQVAREIKRRGWIVIDGRRAVVTPASARDDDERVDFRLVEDAAA